MKRLVIVAVAFVSLFGFLGLKASAQGETPSGDAAIMSWDAYTLELLPGACYVINGGSNEGCDENGDGGVTFEGVPVGTYTVTMTRAPEGYQPAPDFTISIDDSGYTPHPYIYLEPVAGPPAGVTSDVHVETYDAVSGEPLYDACYLIDGASNVGCDENGDGWVLFEDVQVGHYAVAMVTVPAGHEPAADQDLWVTGDGYASVHLTFYVDPADSPPEDGTINVSIKSVDFANGSTVGTGPGGVPGACYVIDGASNEGCDENSDGVVTFQDVPLGTYILRMTNAPEGYQQVEDREVTIGPAGGTWQSLQIEVVPAESAKAPADQQPAAVVTKLPNTGNGAAVGGERSWLELAMAAGAATAGAGAIARRRLA